MPVGFSCHIFDAEAQELAEQVVMATAQAFRAIQESGQSDSLSFASMNSLESRDSGMSKGSSRLSYPTASTVKPKVRSAAFLPSGEQEKDEKKTKKKKRVPHLYR